MKRNLYRCEAGHETLLPYQADEVWVWCEYCQGNVCCQRIEEEASMIAKPDLTARGNSTGPLTDARNMRIVWPDRLPDDTYNQDVMECPYCHHKDRDACELGDGGEGCGETECGHCGRDFRWVRSISVSYTALPMPNGLHERPGATTQKDTNAK